MLSQVAELSPVVLVIVVYRMFHLKTFLQRETKRNGKNSPPPQKNYYYHIIKRSCLFLTIVLVFKQEP